MDGVYVALGVPRVGDALFLVQQADVDQQLHQQVYLLFRVRLLARGGELRRYPFPGVEREHSGGYGRVGFWHRFPLE